MPTVVTRGVASARGYGFAGINPGVSPTPTTVIFTSSTTWTAPSGVTSLNAVIGQGGSSTSDYVDELAVCECSITNNPSGAGTNPLPLTGTALTNTANTFVLLSTASNGTYLYNSPTGAIFASDRTFTFYPSGTSGSFSFSDSLPYGSGNFPYILVPETWSIANTDIYPLADNYTYNSPAFWYAVGSAYFDGSAGESTTAFGYTFSGASQAGSYPNATGQAATPATYTSVAVSPGTGYAISVASGGSVTIQYTA